ncbi:hypothetical protein SAMN05421813_103126 [Daejeonella rubra]|uniref:BNR repeat-like domain-containing protein n=1 Tax=Daejeonella rubra TaxID=990371 RepID=A0A1G9NQ00_9SPHI|nr:hypothetical protein [Daejeonella rubra]SDL88431.1 hypothetical protein SAMN05421813_103126 [Daejeonella rubra]
MIRLVLSLLLIIPFKISAADIKGQQPNVAIDTKGTVRLAYGEGEKIYCITSANNGATFSKPVLVGQITDMHLGHTRGPQIASSKNYSLITAIDKQGTIHSFKLNHLNKTWAKLANVNDKIGSAVEGLMALTADKDDSFYATWLDIRSEKKNNIFFSSMSGRSSKWTENLMVYKSPDEHVCECCKPNISFNNNKLAIGFRNWLMGSRDIYYAVSTNKGKTFAIPKKSGTGTWRLSACPMDGGGLAIRESGITSTAWRRNSDVYYWSENASEKKVGSGRDVSMAENKDRTVIAWQDKNVINVFDLSKETPLEIGNGISPRVYILTNGRVICVWEDDKVVRYKLI